MQFFHPLLQVRQTNWPSVGKKKFRHHITSSEQRETFFFSAIQPVMLGRTGTVTKKTCRLQEETEKRRDGESVLF